MLPFHSSLEHLSSSHGDFTRNKKLHPTWRNSLSNTCHLESYFCRSWHSLRFTSTKDFLNGNAVPQERREIAQKLLLGYLLFASFSTVSHYSSFHQYSANTSKDPSFQKIAIHTHSKLLGLSDQLYSLNSSSTSTQSVFLLIVLCTRLWASKDTNRIRWFGSKERRDHQSIGTI